MTLVWLSPGLPADRVELADALPANLTLVAPGPDHVGAGVDALPVGSLCVATAFETALLTRLAYRPAGVQLLVVGPPGQALPLHGVNGRPVDATATTGSVSQLVTAMQRVTTGAPPVIGAAVGPAVRTRPAWLGGRVAGVAAMLVGLLIGGGVIAATEGSASTNDVGPRGGQQFTPPQGGFQQGGFQQGGSQQGGFQAPSGATGRP